MNAAQALSLHAEFLKLKSLVLQKVPKTKEFPHPWKENLTMHYELTGIDLEELTAHYRSYIGCGEYEYETDHIDLTALLGDAA